MKDQDILREEIKGEFQAEPTTDSKLEILKFASQVQSRIKKDITEDFILAKLSEKDKEGIIEMTSNAYFVKKLIETIVKRARKWKWNDKKGQYEKRKLTEEEATIIIQNGEAIFDSYMNRIYMTTILNRNVKDNHLIKIIAGVEEEEKEEGKELDIKEKVKELLKGETTNEK